MFKDKNKGFSTLTAILLVVNLFPDQSDHSGCGRKRHEETEDEDNSERARQCGNHNRT